MIVTTIQEVLFHRPASGAYLGNLENIIKKNTQNVEKKSGNMVGHFGLNMCVLVDGLGDYDLRQGVCLVFFSLGFENLPIHSLPLLKKMFGSPNF